MIFDRLREDSDRNNLAVFIDGPNILRNEFDVDLDGFREQMQQDGSLKIAKVFLNQHAPSKLVEAIVSQGFDPEIGVGEEEGNESDVDVYMAAEAMEAVHNDTIDTIVLVTRDADFLPVLQKAKEHGKNTVVVGFEHGFATALRNAADTVTFLD